MGKENLHVYKNTSKLTEKAVFEKKKNGFKRISIKFYLFFMIMNVYSIRSGVQFLFTLNIQ